MFGLTVDRTKLIALHKIVDAYLFFMSFLSVVLRIIFHEILSVANSIYGKRAGGKYIQFLRVV